MSEAGEPQLRGLDATLEGYAWMPRMFDKARGTIAGDDRPDFGCPVDHTCMSRLGVAPDLVLDLVASRETDEDILAGLRQHGIPSAEDAWFDAVAVEDELQERDVYVRVRKAGDLPEVNGGRAFAGAEHGAGVSVLLLDAEPGEVQPAHSHDLPEVITVAEGEVTVYLGEMQARTLRPGDVGRVPAGMAHRLVNQGDGPVRAVAVQGADEITFTVG